MSISTFNQSMHFFRLSACRYVRVKVICCMRVIMMLLAFGTCLASEGLFVQNSFTAKESIEVDFYDGRLSVSAENISLIKLMQIVGTKAGFKVITFGDSSSQTSSWSFSNKLLAEAIEKILSGTSSIISFSDDDLNDKQSISTVYLLESRFAGDKTIHFNIIEPVPARQPLMDPAQSSDLHERIEAIARLEGLTDELTVKSLKSAVQNDPEEAVRIRAVTALEQIGGTVAASALESGLGDDNSLVRKQVVQALGNIQDERVLLWLGQVLMGDPNADVRFQALLAIAQKNNGTAQIFLEAAVKDNSSLVSETALQLLR